MSIAQLSVAGEVNSYAFAEEIIPPTPRRLKRVTLVACELALRMPGLTRTARRALSVLAMTANNDDPLGRIFKHRDTLCDQADMSPATWYRAQEQLVSAGFITVDDQVRKRHGRFAGAFIYLTRPAAEALGLIKSSPCEASIPDVPADRFDEPSLNSRDPYTKVYRLPDSFQKRQPGQVPADLQRLRALGFFDFLIFKLMREAREQGKRLSDVVEATWTHLKLAKAPINYLRTLLRNPVDFSQMVRRRIDAEAVQSNQAALQAQAVKAAQEHAGKTFIDADGQRQYFIGSDGQSMTITSAEEGVGRQAVSWMQPFAMALASSRIRLATTADLEAFAAARNRTVNTAALDSARAQRTREPASVSLQQRPPVTQEVRAHIASLRRLLQPRAMAT
jgi:hypothetical protein